jgi:hypothetical protein
MTMPDERGADKSSGWVGQQGAESGLQEALFRLVWSEGHGGPQSSGSLARAAESAQVVGQGGLPEV